VAAVIGSVTDSSAAATRKRVRFGSVEPAVLAILKQLDPLVAVCTFALCVLLRGSGFTREIGAVALLTLITCSRVFCRQGRDEQVAGKPFTIVFPRIVLEWTLVVCILLLAAFALKVTALFSRAMILTWFAATPITLYAAHVARQRVRWAIANSDLAPRFLIIGANSVGFELSRRLPQKGFLGFFDFRSVDRLPDTIDSALLLGHCKDVAEFARKNGVSHIYIALPLSNVPRIGEMVRELRDTTASTCSPSISSRDAWWRSTACRRSPSATRLFMAWMPS